MEKITTIRVHEGTKKMIKQVQLDNNLKTIEDAIIFSFKE